MSPQVDRQPLTTAITDDETGLTTAPLHRVHTDYWIVVVTRPGMTPADAQAEAYQLARDITSVILRNQFLQLPESFSATPEVNEERLTQYSKHTTVSSQPRLTMTQGRMVQSMTVMVRCTTDEDHHL